MEIKEALEIADTAHTHLGIAEVEALKTLATELRRLTTLRAMSEAPEDERINVRFKGAYWEIKTIANPLSYANATGWLPLPSPEDYK